jgi:hypothetical protein
MSFPPVVVLGATTGPRREALSAAMARRGVMDPRFIGYDRFVADPGTLTDALTPGAVVRFDSPDRDRASLAGLYGAGAALAEDAGYRVLSGAALAGVLDARGPIGSPAQLALGLARTLSEAATRATAAGARLLAGPGDVACSFDKTACSQHLEARGLPVPRRIGAVSGFDDLIEQMRSARLPRVFVKLRHGSSAAGMTALAQGAGGQLAAYTTAVIGDGGVLSSTRAVQRLTNPRELGGLIDRLAPLGLHVEAWLPKAGSEGRSMDLRVIVVAGRPVFSILRLSANPMTNLHLGGERRPAGVLRRRVGETTWRRLMEMCTQAARAFPSCFMVGVDAALLVGDRRTSILEVNAFGDHVKGVRYRGFTPHDWQIIHWGAWARS